MKSTISEKSYKLNRYCFSFYTLFILFVFSALVASASLAPEDFPALPDGFKITKDDVRILVPEGKASKYSPYLRAREIDFNDSKYANLIYNLSSNPGFIQQIRDYQNLRTEKGKPSRPLTLVLDEHGNLDISFNKGTSVVTVIGLDGKTKTELKASNLTFLSQSRVNDLSRVPPSEYGMEVLVHEFGHTMHSEMTGLKMAAAQVYTISQIAFGLPEKKGFSHWKTRITSEEFALVEGFAEYCGDYYPGTSVSGSTFPYLMRGYDEVLGKNELYATEGFFAAILMNVANGEGIENGHQKILQIFKKYKPTKTSSFFSYFAKEYPNDKAALINILDSNTNGVISELEPTPLEKITAPSEQKRLAFSAAAGIGGLALGLAIPGLGTAVAPIIAAVAGSATYQALGDEGKTSLVDAIKGISLGRVSGAAIGSYFGIGLLPILGPVGPIVGGLIGGLAGDWIGKKIVESAKSRDSYSQNYRFSFSSSIKKLKGLFSRDKAQDELSNTFIGTGNFADEEFSKTAEKKDDMSNVERQRLTEEYYKAVEEKDELKVKELGALLQ